MRPGRAADHAPTSSAANMEALSYTSTHPLGHTGPLPIKEHKYIHNIVRQSYMSPKV